MFRNLDRAIEQRCQTSGSWWSAFSRMIHHFSLIWLGKSGAIAATPIDRTPLACWSRVVTTKPHTLYHARMTRQASERVWRCVGWMPYGFDEEIRNVPIHERSQTRSIRTEPMQRKIRIHPDFPIVTRWRQKPRRRQKALWKHWQAGAMPTAMGLWVSWVSRWPDGILGVLILAYSWDLMGLCTFWNEWRFGIRRYIWRMFLEEFLSCKMHLQFPLSSVERAGITELQHGLPRPAQGSNGFIHPRFLSSVGRSWNSWACWAAAVLALWNWCSTCPDRWLERGS